jgi:hypothetical protein
VENTILAKLLHDTELSLMVLILGQFECQGVGVVRTSPKELPKSAGQMFTGDCFSASARHF